ncbi:MAG: YbaB/EbfC family nucleoid-associated protein [Patescibacteria group bacterium]
MAFLQKARDMYRIQKQAKGIKKDLKNIHIEAEEGGVSITVNAEMEVVSVQISDEAMQNGKVSLQGKIEKAFGKALKKAQQVAAEKMKGIMGEMGMPGAA